MMNSFSEAPKKNPLHKVFSSLEFPFLGALAPIRPKPDAYLRERWPDPTVGIQDFRRSRREPSTREPLSLNPKDQEKHDALRQSGATSAIGYDGRWLEVSTDNLIDISRPLNLALKPGFSDIPLGSVNVKPVHGMPSNWEELEWFSAHIINTLQHATLSLTIWNCQERRWESIDDVSEIKNSIIRDSAIELLDIIFKCDTSNETLSTKKFRLHPTEGVTSFCLSEKLLGRTRDIESAVVADISATAFRANISEATALSDQLIATKIKNWVLRFVNPMITANEFKSLSGLIKILVDESKNDRSETFDLANSAFFRPTENLHPNLTKILWNLCLAQDICVARALVELAHIPLVKPVENKPHFYQTTISMEDALALRDRYLREGEKVFEGTFWNDYQPEYQPGARLPREIGSVPVLSVHSLPYDSVIQNIVAFRPEAESMMLKWREIWDRSFPDWQNRSLWAEDKVEKTLEEYWKEWAIDAINEKHYNWKPIDKLHVMDNAIHADKTDLRDYRLHVIDDADKVLSMTHLDAGLGVLKVMDEPVVYAGMHSDGMPKFAFAKDAAKARINKPLDETPRYWNWPFFLKHLGRKGAVAPSRNAAGAILLDMAMQGHAHAFLKLAKGKGTWTLPLKGIKSLNDAENRLHSLLLKDRETEEFNLIIQEHVPFTHEQRFYINNGRVFASACSDRHFCVLDASGKRLDHRLAVLTRPSIDSGYFDRGITRHVEDRKTSALFARKARRIAAELRSHGILEYSLDIGLTDRGPVCIEINTLHNAGPYNLRRELYIRAYKAKATQMRTSLYDSVMREIEVLIEDETLKAMCVDLLERNRDRLPHIFITQFDALPPSTKPDNTTNLTALVVQAFALSALLEQPVANKLEIEVAA
jgi:hypothetical protein